ncbi:hypothetical protein ASE33_18010 [Pseudomonas sp. Root9]|uniref:hypothetical protein n=1 Tax=Pseudomonas sp. Root9 TaxID=1736604 RepID=UPI0006F8C7F1|nr:hypothetical protein [Pseudomonas sp. Root9]KRD02498.1 hypothetical protein ASE33_18010 [Pseudomonas sp. Root9]
MSKSRTDGDSAEAIVVPGLKPAPLGFLVTADAVESIGATRVFRDKVFTSRTLILPGGETLPVVAGRVTACGDDQFAFLKAHPDLEQLKE